MIPFYRKKIKVKDGNGNIYHHPIVKMPERFGTNEAGIDFYVPETFRKTVLDHGEEIVIESGVYVNIPPGKALIFFNKSSIAIKKGLVLGACVVDETYQGEIMFNLICVNKNPTVIYPNEKIVQGLLINNNYEVVNEIENLEDLYFDISKRGKGWLGSTNK